jgi:hypothetical protein
MTIKILTIIISLLVLLVSSTKKNVKASIIGFFISLVMLASLVYENRYELLIIASNILFILLFISYSYKEYDRKIKK